jgi:hypothetical protein
MHFSFSGIAAETVAVESMKTARKIHIILLDTCIVSTPSPCLRIFEVVADD